MKLTSQMLLVDLLDADVLTGEDGAEVDLAAAEADAAAVGDGDGAVVERVVRARCRPRYGRGEGA